MYENEGRLSPSAVRRQTGITAVPCLVCYGAAGVASAVIPGNSLLLPLAGFFAACAGCAIQDGGARLKASLAAEAREKRVSGINGPSPE